MAFATNDSNIIKVGAVPPGTAPTPPERRAPTVNEVVRALEQMGLALGYDKLANEPAKTGPLPWDEVTGTRAWAELDDAELYALLQGRLGLRSEKALACATTIYAHRHAYDPLTAMLKNGKERSLYKLENHCFASILL